MADGRGNSAASYALANKANDACADDALEYTKKLLDSGRGGIVDIDDAVNKIRNVMWDCGAIVRTHERCKQGIDEIESISADFNPIVHFSKGEDIKQVTKLRSYIEVSKLLLTIMDYRKESRGPHYRMDYPDKSQDFAGPITAYKKGGGIELELIKFK